MRKRKRPDTNSDVKPRLVAQDDDKNPFAERKRMRCRKTKVIAWQRHKCNNGIHTVGITYDGELVFLNHTKAELKSLVMMLEFGAEDCKCASLYQNWKASKLGEIQLENIARERMNWSKGTNSQLAIAQRAMFKFRKRRYKHKFFIPYTYNDNDHALSGYTDSDDKLSISKSTVEKMISNILKTLRSWGWSVSKENRAYDKSIYIETKSTCRQDYISWLEKKRNIAVTEQLTAVTFERGQRGNGSVTCKGNRIFGYEVVHSPDLPRYNHRWCCDMAECSIILEQLKHTADMQSRYRDALRDARTKHLQLQLKELQTKFRTINKQGVNFQISANGDVNGNSSYSLILNLSDLNDSASLLMMRELLTRTHRTVNKINKASARRLNAEMMVQKTLKK